MYAKLSKLRKHLATNRTSFWTGFHMSGDMLLKSYSCHTYYIANITLECCIFVNICVDFHTYFWFEQLSTSRTGDICCLLVGFNCVSLIFLFRAKLIVAYLTHKQFTLWFPHFILHFVFMLAPAAWLVVHILLYQKENGEGIFCKTPTSIPSGGRNLAFRLQLTLALLSITGEQLW